MIYKLPEELDGIISAEEWTRMKSGYKVRIGEWAVSYASGYSGLRAWLLSDKRPLQIFICSMTRIDQSPFDIRVTYAALQLIVRAPDALIEMFEAVYGKNRLQGCLNLGLE